MNGESVCARNDHALSTNAESLYDEVSHRIDNNILSVKLIKDRHRVQTADERAMETVPTIDVNCLDKHGNRCKRDCPKVNVIHNQTPASKRPEEEMLILKTIRQMTPYDDMKHSLEVEFKSSRNYSPLPEPGPSPPIIVPRELIIARKDKLEKTKKGKPGKKKKKRRDKR